MQTLVIAFSLIIWAFGARTADIIMPVKKTNPKSSDEINYSEIHGTTLTQAHLKKTQIDLEISGSNPLDRKVNLPALEYKVPIMVASINAEQKALSFRNSCVEFNRNYVVGFSIAFIPYQNDGQDPQNSMDKSITDKHVIQIFEAGKSEGSLIGIVAAHDTGAEGFIGINGPGSPADKFTGKLNELIL